MLLFFPPPGIVLPHQQDIERMSNFREQLGEDWLRYQHHLDGALPSTITTAVNTKEPTPPRQPLPNGLNTTTCPSTSAEHPFCPPSPEVRDVLPPPLLSSGPRMGTSDMDAEPEAELTLQWRGQSSLHTESTLEDGVVDGKAASSPGPSPETKRSARGGSIDTKEEEEEEEDLGGGVIVQETSFAQIIALLLISFLLSSCVYQWTCVTPCLSVSCPTKRKLTGKATRRGG